MIKTPCQYLCPYTNYSLKIDREFDTSVEDIFMPNGQGKIDIGCKRKKSFNILVVEISQFKRSIYHSKPLPLQLTNHLH